LSESITQGKRYYESKNYEAAREFYMKSLRNALINMNVLYGEHLHNFDEAEKVTSMLLEIDGSSVEAMANRAEALLRTNKSKEARKYALEIQKMSEDQHKQTIRQRHPDMIYPDTLNFSGYKVVSKLFNAISYILENDKTNICESVENFFGSVEQDSKIPPQKWSFKGLIKSIDDNTHVNSDMKDAIKLMVDLVTPSHVSKDDAYQKVKSLLNCH
jgi:tetratricopeptide (TPR) repeat protein